MSVPAYESYRDSGVEWVGATPKHWEVIPLLVVATECDRPNLGMIENNLLSLSYGRIVRKNIDDNDGLLPESFETYQIVEPKDVVWRLTDLQNDKRSLRTALVGERGIITSAYLATTPVSIFPNYYAYLLRAYDLQKVFYSMGGGLRQGMKFSDVRRLPLLRPPLSEQAVISAFLDRETAMIDALVEEQRRLIDLLKEKRQAVISHAVTKGLDPSVPMKDSGVEWLGEVPAHWTVARLKFVAHIQTGVAKGKDTTGQETKLVPYLRVANVQDGWIDLTDVAQIDMPVSEIARYELRAGDVLMNEGGDFDKLGRGGIWDGSVEPCIHQNHVFAVRPFAVSPQWLNFTTTSASAQFFFMGRSKQSTNLASISSTNLMELPLLLPPKAEQDALVQEISEAIQQIDELTSAAEAAIELLSERRAALISAAVTGKIDVRGLVDITELEPAA